MADSAELVPIMGPCDGVQFFSITLGAVLRFDQDTKLWSERLYYGPVNLRQIGKRKDILALQVCNRLTIESLRLNIFPTTDFHLNGSTLMFRGTDGEVYGLVGSNGDMIELQKMIGRFFKRTVTPVSQLDEKTRLAVNNSLKSFLKMGIKLPNKERIIGNTSVITTIENDEGIDIKVFSPAKAVGSGRQGSANSSARRKIPGSEPRPESRSESRSVRDSPIIPYAVYATPLPEPRTPAKEWMTKPSVVPESVVPSSVVPGSVIRHNFVKKSVAKYPLRISTSPHKDVTPSYLREQAHVSQLPPIGQAMSYNEQSSPVVPPSIELPTYIRSRVPFVHQTPGPKIEPIMDLVQFAYKEGLRKGVQDASELNEEEWFKSFNLTSSQIFTALTQMVSQDGTFRIKLQDALSASRTAKN